MFRFLGACLNEVYYSVTLRDWNLEEVRQHWISFIIASLILLSVPFVTFCISYSLITLKWWTCQVDNLVVILGIALAGTLVRSARPFPITNPCHFDSEEEINRLKTEFLGAKRSIYAAGFCAGILLFFVMILPSIQDTSLIRKYPQTVSAIIGSVMSMTVIVIPFWYAIVDYHMTKKTVQGIHRAFTK